MANKLNAEFQLLLHPDLPYDPKEVALLYNIRPGSPFEDLYANKITPKNWQVNIYDIPIDAPLEFFLRIVLKDGRIMIGKKEHQNWKINIRDNTNSGLYKAQVRIGDENLAMMGRKCLICDQVVPKEKNMCKTPECMACYCPKCNRMLPPHSNYCPWDKISFPI